MCERERERSGREKGWEEDNRTEEKKWLWFAEVVQCVFMQYPYVSAKGEFR